MVCTVGKHIRGNEQLFLRLSILSENGWIAIVSFSSTSIPKSYQDCYYYHALSVELHQRISLLLHCSYYSFLLFSFSFIFFFMLPWSFWRLWAFVSCFCLDYLNVLHMCVLLLQRQKIYQEFPKERKYVYCLSCNSLVVERFITGNYG